jgi:hypothetical protein
MPMKYVVSSYVVGGVVAIPLYMGIQAIQIEALRGSSANQAVLLGGNFLLSPLTAIPSSILAVMGTTKTIANNLETWVSIQNNINKITGSPNIH